MAFLAAALTEAAVIRVPEDVGTIEEALQAAAPFDTMNVASGIYLVNLRWPETDGLSLVSRDGPAETILDGSGKAQVVGFYTGVDTTTVVSGFTIRNGHAEGQ